MNFLYVIPEYPPQSGGGIGTFYGHFLPELLALGHQVSVLVANPFTAEFADYEQEGIKVCCLPQAAIAKQFPFFAHYAAMPELQRILATAWAAWDYAQQGQGFDVIETTDWGLLFAPWIVSEETPPTVVQLHGSIGQIDSHDPHLDKQLQGDLIRLLEISCFQVADALQTNSASNARDWSELTGRTVETISPAFRLSAVDLSSVDLSAVEPEALDCQGSGVVVGRIQHWKGVEILCQALSLMREKQIIQPLESSEQSLPRLLWIGRDTDIKTQGNSMSDSLARRYPKIWHQQVQSLGMLSAPDTQRYQRSADYIVVPSIWDVFNLACVEGMALGQVVLCSKGAGAAELIEHGINGITFEGNDPQALVEAFEYLNSLSETQKSQIKRAARETIQDKLAPMNIAQQRVRSYEAVSRGGRSPIRPNEWLKHAIAPREPMGHSLAFLDQLPLKPLGQYLMKRSLQKIIA